MNFLAFSTLKKAGDPAKETQPNRKTQNLDTL